MNKELLVIENWVLPLIIVAACAFLGIVAQRVVNKRLAEAARQSGKKTLESLLKNLHGLVALWFVLAGAYLAMHASPMVEEAHVIISKFLFAVAVISVTIFLARVGAEHLKVYATRAEGVLPSTSIFINIMRILVLLGGVFVIMDCYGISILHIMTAMGVVGLAGALALQPTLQNLFAGIQILASRQLKVGDYVKLDTGEDGYVADIGWRITALRTLSNNMIFVPNSKLAGATLVNYHLPDRGIDVIVQVGVVPTCDHLVVEKECLAIAKEVMTEVAGGDPAFEPEARFNSISEASIMLTVVLRAQEYKDQFRVRDEFIRRATARFKKEGVFKSIASVDKHT